MATTKKKATKKSKAAARPPKARAAKAPAKKAAKAPAKKARATAKKSAAATPAIPPRRAIFIDVENTSSEAALFEAIDNLKIDRLAQRVELAAVGNWRAVGPQVARQLGSLGAQLIHSAPARGVRDWSDLWIAVAAGCWLGQAAPGDRLDIVSNDRAFDAVGDAAAARGVIFRRLQHQRGSAAPAAAAESADEKPKRRARGGRRRGRRRPESAATTAHASATHSSPPPPRPAARPAPPRVQPPRPPHSDEPHGASHAQIIEVIARLTKGEAGRWVNIDVLEKALKEQGFSRPPGSPRLVTRLRQLKAVEVDSHGRVRATDGEPAADQEPMSSEA